MKPFSLALLTAVIAASPALAHDAEGSHGGRIVDAGEYHVELVAKASAIEVFVTDGKDRPVAATFKGVAILLVDGKQQRIPLESAAPGRLTGKTNAAGSSTVKGVVQLTGSDGKSVTARFQ
jgi:hypothetical protein